MTDNAKDEEKKSDTQLEILEKEILYELNSGSNNNNNVNNTYAVRPALHSLTKDKVSYFPYPYDISIFGQNRFGDEGGYRPACVASSANAKHTQPCADGAD